MAFGCTVRELLQRIDSRELTEWMAFYSLDPWGEERADLRAGIIASTTANVWRGKKDKAAKPTDFMPNFGLRPEPQRKTGAEMAAFMRAFTEAMGGEVR